MGFTQSCCDTCWPTYAASVGSTSEPARLVEEYREEETCCYCGTKNKSGIYVNVDPRKVPFPQPV